MAITDTNGIYYASGQPYYDNFMTNWFLQNFPDALNTSSTLLERIKRRPVNSVSGRGTLWPIIYGKDTGQGTVGYNTGQIPDPGTRSGKMASCLSKKLMARIKIDGDTFRHGKTNGGAYVEANQIAMEGMMKSIQLNRARQVHNDGSGRIAEVKSIAGAGTACTITLKVNSDIEGATNTKASGTLDANGFIDVGDRVAFCTNAGVLDGTAAGQVGWTVVAVAASGNDVTIQVAASLSPGTVLEVSNIGVCSPVVAAGHWMVTANKVTSAQTTIDDTGLRHEIMGIAGIFSDTGVNDGYGTSGSQQSLGSYAATTNATTNFQGIAVLGNAFNQGVVLDNGGTGNRPLTEELLQQAISDAERINNANVEFLISHHATYNSYVSLLTPDKRYQNTTQLSGGHTGLTFNGLDWIKDRFMYQNRVVGMAPDQLEMLETAPLQPLTMNDIHIWERLQEYDSYWRGWVMDDQLAVTGLRNRAGFILTELNA
jgi:hypothetical protein